MLVAERAAWIARVPDVRTAVLNNALNEKHPEQALWMKRYEAMIGKEFLWPDEEA